MKSATNYLSAVVFTLSTTLLASGCALNVGSSDQDASGTESGNGTRSQEAKMVRSEKCTKTYCEYQQEECYSNCQDCLNMGGDSKTCSHACSPTCDDYACSHDSCYEKEISFNVVGDPDPELQAACDRFANNEYEPGDQDRPDCREVAIAQKPEMAQIYSCMADVAASGSDDYSSCPKVTARGTLGDDMCSRMGSCGSSWCSDAITDVFNQLEVRASSEQIARTAHECLDEPGCEAKKACLTAWSNALLGYNE